MKKYNHLKSKKDKKTHCAIFTKDLSSKYLVKCI